MTETVIPATYVEGLSSAGGVGAGVVDEAHTAEFLNLRHARVLRSAANRIRVTVTAPPGPGEVRLDHTSGELTFDTPPAPGGLVRFLLDRVTAISGLSADGAGAS